MSAKLQGPGLRPTFSQDPAPKKAAKTNFRLSIAVVLATIESSRYMYVMVINKFSSGQGYLLFRRKSKRSI
jgi:hypothetical protein